MAWGDFIQAKGYPYVSGTSAGGTFDSSVTANSILSLAAFIGGTGRDVTVSDDVNGAWRQAVKQTQTTDGHEGYLFYLPKAASGVTTVTVSISGAAGPTIRLAMMEHAGSASGGTVDRTMSAEGNNGAPGGTCSSTDTSTTTVATELLVGGATNDNTVGNLVWTAGAGGWTKRATGMAGSNENVAAFDRNVTGTGAYRNDPTLNEQTEFTSMIATLYDAAAATPQVLGTLEVGNVLTADPGPYTPISYVWQHADDATGTNLVTVGSTGSTYTLDSGDLNKYIRAGIVHS